MYSANVCRLKQTVDLRIFLLFSVKVLRHKTKRPVTVCYSVLRQLFYEALVCCILTLIIGECIGNAYSQGKNACECNAGVGKKESDLKKVGNNR